GGTDVLAAVPEPRAAPRSRTDGAAEQHHGRRDGELVPAAAGPDDAGRRGRPGGGGARPWAAHPGPAPRPGPAGPPRGGGPGGSSSPWLGPRGGGGAGGQRPAACPGTASPPAAPTRSRRGGRAPRRRGRPGPRRYGTRASGR